MEPFLKLGEMIVDSFFLLFTCVFASPVVYHKLLLACYNLRLILFLLLVQ